MTETNKEFKKVIEYILSGIEAGELSVGDKLLSERALASKLDISRNSAREGLSTLEHIGLIESRRGSGNYISNEVDESISSILNTMMHLKMFNKKELFEFRLYIDKMVCNMLIEKNENLDKIANRAEAILRREAKTPEEEREKDGMFHYSLLRATGNRMLITVVNSAVELFSEMILSIRYSTDEESKKKLDIAHFNIVKAIRDGNSVECTAAIDYHYQVVDEIIKKAHLKEYYAKREFDTKFSRNGDIDTLTGMYTKDAFFRILESYRFSHPEEELVIWVSDIQGLRFINERYGIEVGDRILVQISKIGRNMGNFLFGGRVNGDKLVAVLKEDHADYDMVNQMLMQDSDTKFPIRNVVVKNGVYHVSKDDGLSSYSMYVRAEMALLSIKDSYTKLVQEYDDSLRNELIGNMMIEEDAEEALTNEEFKVYLQPKVAVADGRVAGAEALVRWIHPERGFMNPGQFIPIFEQSGFILKLDLWMWESVCKMLGEWKENGNPMVPVSVNFSRNSFLDRTLADKLIAIADRYEIDHHLLEIEVTEYACIDNIDNVYETVSKLHDNDFRVSLDDFGTGYSSMVVISRLDIDFLKLDMSLIRGETGNSKRSALEFALQLAKMMQLKTVAEGIESQEQVSRIKELGADYIQGYFFSKPLPRDEFELYVKECCK